MLRQAVALTCCLVGQALADPLYSKMEEDMVQDPEGRLFFTSSGGMSLTNSTVDLGMNDLPFGGIFALIYVRNHATFSYIFKDMFSSIFFFIPLLSTLSFFYAGAILAAVLIGLLFFLTLGQNFFGASAGSGSAYGYQRQGESLHNNEFYARSDKRVQDTGKYPFNGFV